MTIVNQASGKRRSGAETRRLVIDATRRRIESEGAVTLKISDVVRETGIADVIIYRHFGDRRGVIVEALAELWLEFTRSNIDEARRVIRAAPAREITASLLASLMVGPEDPMYRRRRWLRVQTLAAAQEFPELRQRIADEQQHANERMEDLLDEIRVKNELGPFSIPIESIRSIVLGMTLGYTLNDVAGPTLTDDAQRQFWELFFVSVGLAVPG